MIMSSTLSKNSGAIQCSPGGIFPGHAPNKDSDLGLNLGTPRLLPGLHRLPHTALVAAVVTAIVLALLAPLYTACGLALMAGVGIYLVLLIAVAVS